MKKEKVTAPVAIKIAVKISNNHLRIYLDDLLHLSVKADDISGVHTYKAKGYWHIDYHVDGIVVACTYKIESTWVRILKELQTINII